MLFISHLYIASKLFHQLKVKNASTYYFASILPDIRYTTNLEREQTHVQLKNLHQYFKVDSDLYKGYYLHLFVDEYMGEWQFHEKFNAKYPRFLQRVLKPMLLNVIVELYAWEHLKKLLSIKLDDRYYSEYKKFGMKKQDVENYATYFQAMLDDFSIETATKVMLSDPKLKNNKKVIKYKKIGAILMRIAPLKWYLIQKVHAVYEEFVKDVQKHMLMPSL